DKVAAELPAHIRKQWLESNGFKLDKANAADIKKLDATLRRENISDKQANKYIAEFNNKGYLSESSSLVNVERIPTKVETMSVGPGQGELSKIYREGTDGKTIEVRYPIDVKNNGLTITYPYDVQTGDDGGGRTLPITDPNSVKRNHNGVDIYVKEGTQLGSLGTGQVIKVVNTPESFLNGSPETGASVTIEYGEIPNTVRVTYGHLSNINVNQHDFVKPGDLVGLSGNSGHSEGPHLHFTIIKNGVLQDPETFDWSTIK
ncbi:M23 family metallopeptidase, partial [Leptospira ilyithenensis]